ncbi:MAG: BREX-1 system adenine-specific DNA-methyltransferase PglX [Candidatus Desulfofervidaceae bacterium]|nr:BREX-1 system adenine-specific DNA-methyltransferase PglX [Candidatus Desulfofervidaceae bacterium]
MSKHNPVPNVYLYRQGDFDAIPGSPWVYWITPGLKRVFEELPKLEEVAKPIHGTATYDNFRFLRYWWEVGVERIGFDNRSWDDFEKSDEKFVPYLKGGKYKKWYGNQEFVIHVANKAKALIAFLDSKRDSIRGLNYVFRRGVTYSFLTSGSFSARLSPGGFIFDVAGSSLFPESSEDIYLILGVLNSTLAHYILKIINPTVNFQVGDLARLPIPQKSSDHLRELVEKVIELAKKDAEEDETTWDFIAPPEWPDGIEKVARRHAELAEIERQIDEEVYRLYEISEEDRRAIEEELGIENF